MGNGIYINGQYVDNFGNPMNQNADFGSNNVIKNLLTKKIFFFNIGHIC